MFRPSPFRTVLVALALASCGTRRGEIAIDTGESLLDAPESVTPPSGGEGLSVDPQTGAVEISVGFRETAPVDGEAKTVKPSPTMAPAG